MPRIDPEQLLNCLQVLLTPTGGILSKDEVQRLANLMTKFSKKLVSKCIYVLILKNTDKQLLGSFMAEGGWNLIHIWLQDAHLNKNWALVTEVLELLLITPVDVERLKMNNLPKLVKSLTKRDDLAGVQRLATALVEEWLKIVKDVTKAEAASAAAEREAEENAQQVADQAELQSQEQMEVESGNSEYSNSENTDSINSSLRFKVALKDGKQVISKIDSSEDGNSIAESGSTDTDNTTNDVESEKKDRDDKKKEKSNHERNKYKTSSSSAKSTSSKDKERSRDKSKDGKSSTSSSKSSSSRDKDKRDKHRSNGSSKHRSSSSSKSSSSSSSGKDKDKKENKEKQAEKDKDTLAKIQPQILAKIGRIPKKTEDKNKSTKKDEVKKPTFSVEVRKSNEEKPKTVKIFNSKMRSTGLLEEVKPPPPRTAVPKKPTPTMPAVLPVKRPSPIRDIIPPPEKKSRLMEVSERPGSIKLIPPKPKPAVLQESDIFMDALTASATMKKEPKKRKRRPSSSKDTSPPSSPAHATPTSPSGNIKNITPANFYQDTLETENDDDKDKENHSTENEKMEIPDTPAEPDEEQAPVETTKTDSNGLRGVLSYSKRKGPKRSLRWKADPDLVEIQYFELDETERVNVMKPFMDMARMEMNSERETMRARKLQNEDLMDSQMTWRAMIEMDLPAPQAEIGSKSLEKDIQFAREKRVLQALYFHKPPDTPGEPENETHPLTNAITIPLDDPENPEQDAPLQPWPEPKGSPPHVPNVPPIFPPGLPGPPFINLPVPPGGFPPAAIPPFPPGFMPPNMMRPPGPEWNGIPNGMPPPNMPPPDMMNSCPPNMFDGFVPNMGDNGFPPPFSPPNNMPPMFPPNNFNNNMRGRGGGYRRGNSNGPWLRMAGPGQGWNGPRGGGPNRGGRFCINVKKHGYCRNRDNCPFVHPN